MRGELLQTCIKIVVEPRLIIVNEDRGRNMHGSNKHQALGNPALFEAFFHLQSNVDEGPTRGHSEEQFLAIAFHVPTTSSILLGITSYQRSGKNQEGLCVTGNTE
jgi:hypothetical protein